MIRGIWRRLPAAVQATLVAVAILAIGQLPPGILVAGLRTTPRVPWFLPLTAIWLLLFWFYLSGRGWPATTAAARETNLRGKPLPARIWLWSLTAGLLGMASVLSGAILTGRVATLPREAYAAPLDLSSYPSWTVIAFFLNLALVAGVVEEAAFRGYMLSMIERRHGWLIAIIGVAVAFYAVHLTQPYATVAFIPFFVAYSLLHGALVFATRSIRPSVLIHVLGDFTILPIQYGAVPSPLGTSIGAHVIAIVAFGAASLAAFWRLAHVVRRPGNLCTSCHPEA